MSSTDQSKNASTSEGKPEPAQPRPQRTRTKKSIFMPRRDMAEQLRYKSKPIHQPLLPPSPEVRYDIVIYAQAAPIQEKSKRGKRKAPDTDPDVESSSQSTRLKSSRRKSSAVKVKGTKRRKVEERTENNASTSEVEMMKSRLQVETKLRRNVIEAPKESVLSKGTVDVEFFGKHKMTMTSTASVEKPEVIRPIAPLPSRASTGERKVQTDSASSGTKKSKPAVVDEEDSTRAIASRYRP